MAFLARPPAQHSRRSGATSSRAHTRSISRVLATAGALSVAALPLLCSPAAARTGLAQEYDIKAAFLFNFAQFVEWPSEAFPTPDAPFVIGVLGKDPFGSSLDEIVANEGVGNRRLVVRRFRTVEEVAPCQILFVSPSETGRLDDVHRTLGRRGILTVGETPDFAPRSGIIGFVVSQSRLRLRIDLAAARAAGLTISSKLLRQAQIVGAGSKE